MAEGPYAERVAAQDKRRITTTRVVIHAVGALVTIVIWVVLAYAHALVAFFSTVCGTATARDVRVYRIEVFIFGAIATLVPFVVGLIVRRLREQPSVWFAVTAIVAGVMAAWGARAHTPQFCLF